MDTEDSKKPDLSETDPLIRVSNPKPQLVQRRKWLGCLVILTMILIGVLAVCLGVGLGIGVSKGISSGNTLYKDIKIENLMVHLQKLQDVAEDFNMSRAVQYGFNESAEFVVSELEDAGYNVSRQYFSVPIYEDYGNSSFSVSLQLLDTEYTWNLLQGSQYSVMRYSGNSNGPVSGELQPLLGGCSESDFTLDTVAFLNYSTDDCSLFEKVSNAFNVGVVAVVMMRPEDQASLGPPTSRIYNQRTDGFDLVDIPVLGATYQLGQQLLELIAVSGNLTVHIETYTSITNHTTYNVLAYTDDGNEHSTIVMGSHLDSVPAGPGINDNGSGSMANLEIAIQMAKKNLKAKNKVLFAFWGAEELGLLGSEHFVMNLMEEERSHIALNLNFDMLGSPNFVRQVYNGSDANESIAVASGRIQSLFEKHFESENLPYEPKDFNGRSDYGPFIAVNIPAGGLATGADEVKSAEQRTIFGGLANAILDPCYHRACDTVDNIDCTVYEQMAQAAASVLDTLMMQDDLRGFLNATSS